MANYGRDVGIAVTIALLGVLGLAGAALYLVPTSSPQSQTATSSVTSQTSGETSTLIIPPPGGQPYKPYDSPLVQPYIQHAYSYGPTEQSWINKSAFFVLIETVQNQEVAGNWTTGYSITYSDEILLNVTVIFKAPSNYTVTEVIATNLPNEQQSISFSSVQQQVIQVALSNSTVRNYEGSDTYYVATVHQFPLASSNQTLAGEYFVQLNQVNSKGVIGIYVDSGVTNVVAVDIESQAA